MKMAYQFLLFHYLLLILSSYFLFLSHSSNSSCLPHQSSILLQLKREFSPIDPEYSKMRDWKEGSDCCLWNGVSCNMETGHVVSLDLSNSGLDGCPLRSNSSLFRLLHLEKLNLAYNDFNSCLIPAQFGQLSKVTHLNLSHSGFCDPMPSQILNLTNLVSLDLSSYSNWPYSLCPSYQYPELLRRLAQNLTNLRQLHLDSLNLFSKVPESLANLTSLTHLSLHRCSLHGEFPKKIFQLSNLQIVDLSYNDDLIGSLPEFHSGSNLISLQLQQTEFEGKIPNSVGNLKSLKVLRLSECKFSGPVPYSLWNFSQLSYLSLSSNYFNGQLPSSLNLAKITQLQLEKNEFSGEFPSSLNLPHLKSLDVSDNNFRSQIPSSLRNLTHLTSLDLSDNHFHGSFPLSLPYLLEEIGFHNASLTGPIPSRAFNNLTFLSSLDLSTNSLNGVIPSSLLTLPPLKVLILDDNQFIGLESILISNSSQLFTLTLGGNKLNGHFPTSIFKLNRLTDLYLNSNNLSGRVNLGIVFSELSMLNNLDLSYNSLSLTTNVSMNVSALPKFKYLQLSSCSLSGFPDFLKAQNELVRLDLSHNIIGGPIPKWFLSIATMNLRWLSLSHNFISGWEEVPLVLPWMELTYLDLSSNMLQGPLVVPPRSTFYFSISNNNLTGTIDPFFCNLWNLRVLDASSNRLGGSIPQCLDNWALAALNLRRNNFHGNIPHFCTSNGRLMTLDLSRNQLYGNIPRSLVNCTDLEVLDLCRNQLSDTFPFWLQNLQRLQVLVLGFNKLHGPICCAHDFVGFMTLKIIDLSHNDFIGKLPSEYFRNWTSMSSKVSQKPNESQKYSNYSGKMYYTDSLIIINKGQVMELVKTLTIFISVDLSNNKFDGEIPTTLWCLRSLIMLNLSSNSFSGLIPSSLGNLKELQSLDLSNNKLFGNIPQQLTALTFLSYLDLSHNQLAGQIPQGGQVSTFQDSSFEGNLGLCGIPSSRKCESPTLPASNDDDNNEKSDSIFGFGWKAVVVGYGCGLLIGMVVGHVMASKRPDLISRVFRVRLQR